MSFAEHAERLVALGFEPIPVDGKRPIPRRWQEGFAVSQWVETHPDANVGLLARSTPAVDVDVRGPDLATAIRGMVDDALGEAPIRIGQAPKCLMPFRLAGPPFKKLKISWRGLGDQHHEPAKPPAVEVLADGQMWVALGTHPGTGKPYTWERGSILETPLADLPPLDGPRAGKLARAIARTLERAGATDVRVTGVPTPRSSATTRATGEQRARANGAPDCGPVDPEHLRRALARIGNGDLDYDAWVRVGLALKSALPGAAGLDLWMWWSGLSAKDNPAVTEKKWFTFEPRDINAATIFYLAGEHR